MSKRNYNIFFNTHTVSGIVISVALYIIFFAGAFAFFKDEIEIWQEGVPISNTQRAAINFDAILKDIDEKYDLIGRDLQINFGDTTDEMTVFLSASKDSLASEKGKKSHYFFKNIISREEGTYEENYNLGEFLYRLHFLDPIVFPIGRYLSGFVALFFLFAIVTGVIVHWKKIIPSFYSFNPKAILKRVWTDAHTALGIIGLPFQFIFAVTGAYFILGILVLVPANFLYNGDQGKLMADLRPERTAYEWTTKSNNQLHSFNDLVKQTQNKWKDFHVTRGFIKNYGGENMKYIINGELTTDKRFIGVGSVVYNAFSGEIESEKNPNTLSYVEDSQFVFGRLHFANFWGYPLKAIYFILALITCFVIITGVLIWVEARNKKGMTLKQRLYTAKVGHIYLAICLSMLPVTALAFLFVKFTNGLFITQKTVLYYFYFLTWLGFILYFRYKRNNYFTNKTSLLLGSIFGFLIPLTNGVISGNWIWNTYITNQYQILSVDILWLLISSTALIVYFKIKPKNEMQSAFVTNPIDYKNLTALRAEEKARLSHKNISKKITNQTLLSNNQNYIPMRTKIIILWLFIAVGWIIHHIYGLFNIYYNESLMMEGATGKAPLVHHIFRIVFEGSAMLFALLTLEVSKKWFRWTALVWAIIGGLYNAYHLIEAVMHESTNYSELFMLLLMIAASVFLIKNLFDWTKLKEKA